MKEQISALTDKILSKGMALLESDRAQQILSAPQTQKVIEFSVSALETLARAKEAAKASIASGLGLATQKDLEALRENLDRVEEKVSDAKENVKDAAQK